MTGFILDRVTNMCNKLYYVTMVMYTTCKDKKIRHPSTPIFQTLNLVLLPVLFAIILMASLLGTSLLPLFTMPIFLVGFPRPTWFWSGTDRTSANVCDDTSFYVQMAPGVVEMLAKFFKYSSSGMQEIRLCVITR